MTNLYPSPYPAPFPPSRPWYARVPSIAAGAAAVIGLLATVLPLWVIHIGADQLAPYEAEEPLTSGSIDITFNFYTWGAGAATTFNLIPLALAVAVAVAVVQLVGARDRGMWRSTAALMVVTVTLLGATALRRGPRTEITGELADKLQPRDLESLNSDAWNTPLSYGAGLIIASVCLLVVLAVATWQSFGRPTPAAVSGPGPAARQPWPPTWPQG